MKVSLQLRVKGDKLDEFLRSLGMNRQEFEVWKERQLSNWKGLQQKAQAANNKANAINNGNRKPTTVATR